MSARGQNQCSKFQFHSESVSNLLGQVYQFLSGTVCHTLDYVCLFDLWLFHFVDLKLFKIAEISAK